MRILGLGTVLVDQQVLLPRFPDVDTKNEISGHRTQVGGPVPTALAQLSRFGHHCDFIGRWSNDPFGQLIAANLKKADLGCRWSQVVDEGHTGFAQVWIDQSNGDRTVAFTRGTCGNIAVDPLGDVDASAFDLLHVDGWSSDAAFDLAQRVRAGGGAIVMDSGSPKPGMERLFPLVDLINCPARFAKQFFGSDNTERAAEELLKFGAKRVVFTHGLAGATLYDSNGKFHQPAFPVEAVDTNGAGDVFCGGLIHALLEQESTETMLRFAAATAALKCQQLGNRDALAELQQVQQQLA